MAGTPESYRPQAQGLYQSRIGDVFSQVRAQFPGAWQKAQTSADDGEFVKRLAWACRQAGIPCFLNWKRGNVGDMSRDVLNFENPTGAPDRAGLLSGVEHVDVIIRHETPDAHYGWADVTVNTTVNPPVFNPPGAFLPTDPGGMPGNPGQPTPGLPAWQPEHTAMMVRLGQPSGALDPAWVRRVAEQLAFSFPADGWGVKAAAPGRPQSGDVIARQANGRLVGYRIVPPTLSPQAIDLAGQHFIPVSPTNHAGVTPTPTPVPTPTPTPTPTPSPDLSQVLSELQVLRVQVEAMQESINAQTALHQEIAAAVKELASKPTVPPTIQWPVYVSNRLPVIGTITLRPQP